MLRVHLVSALFRTSPGSVRAPEHFNRINPRAARSGEQSSGRRKIRFRSSGSRKVDAIRAAGVPVTFYSAAGAGHGDFADPRVRQLVKDFLTSIARWLVVVSLPPASVRPRSRRSALQLRDDRLRQRDRVRTNLRHVVTRRRARRDGDLVVCGVCVEPMRVPEKRAIADAGRRLE